VVAIAYESTAFRTPTQRELEYLLIDSRSFSAGVGVTGALL